MTKEKVNSYINKAKDKRYYFLWMLPLLGVFFYLGRWLIRTADPEASLFYLDVFEAPIVATIIVIYLLMVSLITMNFSFKHQIDFYINRLRETFSSLNPLHKCAIFCFILFNLFWGFVLLTLKLLT